MNYLEGSSTNQPDMIERAFYPEADLYLSKEGHDVWLMSVQEYSKLFDRGIPGTPNGRIGNILSMDIEQDIALAKAEILIPKASLRFIDAFLLKKIAGDWKIISKTATREAFKMPEVKLKKETVMENLARPWSMAFISEEEVIVAEKEGDLLKVNLSLGTRTPILGFPADLADSIVINSDEHPRGTYPNNTHNYKGMYNAGIFEILLDPNFADNQTIYVSYAAQKKEKFTTKVIRAQLKDNKLTNIQTILVAAPYTEGLFHFGGGMTFGLDGKLYITVGERLFGERLEPEIPIAQDLKDKRGKIYRINTDGSIPDDNPDLGPTAIPGLFALGIRAAQGITMQPRTGRIWFSEHGTIQGDEINVLEAGANYGWPVKTTGKLRSPDYTPPKMEGTDFTEPTWYWSHTVAPTGLTFYTGTEFPQWQGDLLVSGLSRGSLWRFSVEGDNIQRVEELFVNDRVRARKIVQSPGGKLYLLTDEVNGKIIRVMNRE